MEEKLKRDREELKIAEELERKRKQDKIETSFKVNQDLLDRRQREEEQRKAKRDKLRLNHLQKQEVVQVNQQPVIDSQRIEPEVQQ